MLVDLERVNLEQFDIHSISTVFKQLIRDVPTGVIPLEFYQNFINCDGSTEEMERIIDDLPDIVYYILRYIFVIFIKIAKYHDLNKMTISNLW